VNELLQLSAIEQASFIRVRKVSSQELVQAHLEQISRVNPVINATVEVLADCAMAEARAADQTLARNSSAVGPLHGVPFSIKDSIEVAGTVCTAGTMGRAAAPKSAADAAVVARLRQAGAIPIAKTNLPDLLFAFESDNLVFGRTNNPYDVTRTAGGSSGGEAALIAACGSPIGLGSDAAGSVRVPAGFCGIASIKPTSGRLPRTGHFPPAGGWIERLWQIGPMARHVEDLGLMMSLLAGSDGSDPTVVEMPFADPAQIDLSALRVAFYTDNGFAAANPEVAEVIRAAAASLSRVVKSVEEDWPGVLACAYDLEMKFLGADGGDSLRRYLESSGSTTLHPLLTGWLEKLEAYRTDLSGFQGYWAELDRYEGEMFAFLSNYDAIVGPVYTQPALPHGASILDVNFRGFSHTMAYNLTGWPAAVVRCGESSSGLPIGVQVIARPWREDVALALADSLEKAFGGWKAPIPLRRPVHPGFHTSFIPLTHQGGEPQ
jgi:amidase